jgi:hypothetical protein
MRILVTKGNQTTLQGLQASLLKPEIAANPALAALAINKLKLLNPQLDFERIPQGAVILLPDDPALEATASFAASGDAFTNLSQDLTRALDVSSAQIKSRLVQNGAEQKALVAALKVGTVARQIADDPELKAQVASAGERTRDVAKKGADDLKSLDSARALLAADLAALERLLG